MSARPTSATPTPRRSRRGLLLAGLVALLAVVAVGGWLVSRPDAEDPSPAATPTADAEPGTYGTSVLPADEAAPTSVPQVVLADVPGRPATLTPVALDQSVDFGDGVTARLDDIKAITAEAHGVGETSGPALVVVVEVTNTGSAPVSLGTVAVNAYLGTDGRPAGRLQGDSGLPFGGSLQPGASAQAVYAFTVPLEERDLVTVTVGVTPESGIAVFAGPVA